MIFSIFFKISRYFSTLLQTLWHGRKPCSKGTLWFIFFIRCSSCLLIAWWWLCAHSHVTRVAVAYIVGVLAGYWPFGLALCAIWQMADVTCCTSSIMHMCTISLDRYSALRRPLIARAHRASVAGVWTRIGFVWTLSFGIASPLIVISLRRPGALLNADRQCFIGYAPFLAYGSLAAFFCPLAVMLVTYALTTSLLRRRAVQAERLSRDGSLRRTTSQRRRRRHGNPHITVWLWRDCFEYKN